MRLMTLAVLLLTTACTTDPAIVACTDIAMSSVTVELVDADTGEPIRDADLTYRSDSMENGDCESFGDGSYTCGWETPGEHTIWISHSDYIEATEVVTVEQGECHVFTEVLEVGLSRRHSECLDDGMFPSLTVTTISQGWSESPLTNATVTYSVNGGPVQDCDTNADSDVHHCGWDQTGNISWTATADGHSTVTGSTTVGPTSDGCHAETVEVEAVLECLNC